MDNYLIPIKYAIIIFPIIAFFFTIPYIIHLYRKYGSISIFRSCIVYSFILYLISIYFLVILPLPKISEVANYKTPYAQLIPFNFVIDFIKHTSLVISNPSTYLKALKEPFIYTIVFNIFITVPFGIYLRYYFKCSFKKTVLLSFLLTLFFELTQLTGLYFIYPRPYRLFDVDDLMINTLGGIIGYAITPIFSKILPSRDKIDETSFERGKRVSYSRRFISFIIDFIFITVFTTFINFFINLDLINKTYIFLIEIILYFSLFEIFTKGRTIGKSIVKIRVVNEDLNKAKIHQYFLRYLLLYGGFLLPIIAFEIMNYRINLLGYILSFQLIIAFIVYYCNLLFSIFVRKKTLLYEKLSHTTHISTIKFNCINENKEEDQTKNIE